jgi:DNA-binding SARP family transcriptional activator
MAARSPTHTPISRLVLGAVAVALVASATTTTPAMAAQASLPAVGIARAAPVIDPATVVHLSDPGVELTAAVDGRLRGDGSALLVTGAALSDQAGQGDQAVSAGPGQHLIVFGLRQISQAAIAADAPQGSLALVVAGARRAIDPSSLDGQGPWYFAAAVPAGSADVDLELSAAGFSQRFSLLTLTRPGPDPAVLYRDPDNFEVVTSDTSAIGVAASVVPDDGERYQVQVSQGTVTLTWFAPDPAAHTPSSPDQAFLTVTATALPTETNFKEHAVILATAIPADKVHLVLADGTRVPAAHTGDTTAVVSGTYYFAVPADITAATLSVDAFTGPGSEFLVATGRPATIALPPFTIALKLPALPAPPPAATTPVTTLKLTHPGAASPAGAGTSTAANPAKTSSRAPLWIVLILLAGAAAVTATVLRRHRRQPTAVTAGPPAPPPASPPGYTPDAMASTPPVTRPAPSMPPPSMPPPSTHPLSPPSATRPPAVNASPSTAAASPAVAPPPPPSPTVLPGEPAPGSVDTSRLRVGLIGPRQITGAGIEKLRPRELEVLVFLAVNRDRPVTNDDIRAAVAGATDNESNAATVRTWLSRIRGAVGSEVLPEADNGRYHLGDIHVDITEFQHLSVQAATATDPTHTVSALKDGLRLVRGRPFEGLDYRWTHVLIANLETQIADDATRLAALSAELHDPASARWAVQRGLAATTQPDDRLLGHLLRAGSADGQLTQAWREVTARYAAVGDAPGPNLVALYDQLRNRVEQRSADAET